MNEHAPNADNRNNEQLQHLMAAAARSTEVLLQQEQTPAMLPDDYTPSDRDILTGRGKRNWNHAGNVAFRNLVQANVDRYMQASSKSAKTAIVLSIVDEVRVWPAHFLKQQNGRWMDIGDAQAREKVGHSLRDQVTARSKNTKAAAQAEPTVSAISTQALPVVVSDHSSNHTLPASPMATTTHLIPVETSSGMMSHHHGIMAVPSSATGLSAETLHHLDATGYTTAGALEPPDWARDASWFHATSNVARRPSEVWSDFGGEEDNRRASLESTAVLEQFGRRPSWLASSFVSTPSSSLQQAAMQAAEAFQSGELADELHRRPDDDVLMASESSIDRDFWNERRHSGNSTSQMFTSGGSMRNLFRSSMRKSSMVWMNEQQQHAHGGSGLEQTTTGRRQSAEDMLHSLQSLMDQHKFEDDDGDVAMDTVGYPV